MSPNGTKILMVQADTAARSPQAAGSDHDVAEYLRSEDFEVLVPSDPRRTLCEMYIDPPDLILLSDDLTVSESEATARLIRADPVFRHLPMILMLPPNADERVEIWAELQLNDFIASPIKPREVFARICLCLTRTTLELDANPLTRLPGNNTILKEIQRRLETGPPFGLAYLDIDSFKAFNDRYGFARGDDALKMTARIVLNAVVSRGAGSGFVGHIGGDDFVLLLSMQQIESACREIIEHFDLITPSLYDEADRSQGFLLLKDRQGHLRRFPLIALSIAVIPSEGRGFDHVGQLIARATELKAAAKAKPGSVYLIDRRINPDPVVPPTNTADKTANFSSSLTD